VNLEEFYGLRVRIVLALIRNGYATQTALARELGTNAKILKKHLAWLVSNGIVVKYGDSPTIYEPNHNHPIVKALNELLKMQDPRGPTDDEGRQPEPSGPKRRTRALKNLSSFYY